MKLTRDKAFGAWTSIGHPSITEIFAASGIDFVGIDLEHSTISLEQAQRIIAAAQAGGAACFPRVASHNGEQIRRLLDSGADGIIVPMVSTTAQVQQIIDWCKYPPVGKRSYGVARAQGYGFDFDQYTKEWNGRSTIVIQIESVEAVEAIVNNDRRGRLCEAAARSLFSGNGIHDFQYRPAFHFELVEPGIKEAS